jgi:hypothetical protein
MLNKKTRVSSGNLTNQQPVIKNQKDDMVKKQNQS